MQTPWGDFAVSDAHIHFFSRRFFESLGSQCAKSVEDTASAAGWDLPPADPAELAHAWAGELHAHGVDRAALIASIPGDEASVEIAVAAHPERFFGYFMLDPLKAGAAERVRAALARGMRAVCLFPAMHCYSMHDECVEAVVQQTAAHRGRVVFVHSGVLSVGVRKKLGLPSPFDMRYSNPIDLHGVALRYPHLRFVIPHFGAGYFREALMVASLCPNVYLDTSSSNSWVRYEGLDLKTVFDRALNVLGARRLLFGTDSSFFPRGWNYDVFEAQARVLLDLGVGAAEARLIFGENLHRILAES